MKALFLTAANTEPAHMPELGTEPAHAASLALGVRSFVTEPAHPAAVALRRLRGARFGEWAPNSRRTSYAAAALRRRYAARTCSRTSSC